MQTIREAAWFVLLAGVMAGWMGVLGSFPGVAEASVIASRGGAGDLREAELAKVQTVLEQKVVMQRLLDYGVSPEEAMAKVRSLSDSAFFQSSCASCGRPSLRATMPALEYACAKFGSASAVR